MGGFERTGPRQYFQIKLRRVEKVNSASARTTPGEGQTGGSAHRSPKWENETRSQLWGKGRQASQPQQHLRRIPVGKPDCNGVKRSFFGLVWGKNVKETSNWKGGSEDRKRLVTLVAKQVENIYQGLESYGLVAGGVARDCWD